MTETLFAPDRRDCRECREVLKPSGGEEYYSGEIWVEDAARIDVRSKRKSVGAMSIVRQRSAGSLFLRRSRQHIRDDATDISILWFVRGGALSFSDPSGSSLARAGDLMVTRSMSPSVIECRSRQGEAHESLYVTVPTHVLRAHLARELVTGTVMAGRAELVMAERMLDEVFTDQGRLGEPSARLLADTALALVAHAAHALDLVQPPRRSIAERRLDDVLRYIEVHLSNPRLSAEMVAKACGISPRYLSSLLRQRETRFSELVWEQRLAKAKAWLGRSDPREVSIGEIAYGVGFKSPAHFSRMFKRVFGSNPREYRGESSAEDAGNSRADVSCAARFLQ